MEAVEEEEEVEDALPRFEVLDLVDESHVFKLESHVFIEQNHCSGRDAKSIEVETVRHFLHCSHCTHSTAGAPSVAFLI